MLEERFEDELSFRGDDGLVAIVLLAEGFGRGGMKLDCLASVLATREDALSFGFVLG